LLPWTMGGGTKVPTGPQFRTCPVLGLAFGSKIA
jgi:hypothetical protein